MTARIRAVEDYTLLVDYSAPPIFYIGEAPAGASTASPHWRIQKLDSSVLSLTWADGNNNFDNVWDNRAGLTYV